MSKVDFRILLVIPAPACAGINSGGDPVLLKNAIWIPAFA